MTNKEEEECDLLWYCMMLDLAVPDQGNLAGPNFAKM